ncbi:AtaL-like protein [Vogesella indigofera]|uniref:AtaL-like protein n=1 Tax=Vogesella indigofera TaxID=45465 RepID=UPI00234E56BC|nr:AtaL-like protein [Vogesella indigofera]MDC7700434.1 DUF1857 family protein [Vogesella indigofera]
MQFEHLIRISPADSSQAPALTRQQLWLGLVLRAELPMQFDENITSARIVAREGSVWQREIAFGTLIVQERIELELEQEVRYHAQATELHPGGSRIMRIEEPEPGVLFVRFIYDMSALTANASEAELARLLPYVKSAYQQADMDTAERIIELIVSGQLTSQ